jgi:glycosyltransferase involved in cell wall biosynthesis
MIEFSYKSGSKDIPMNQNKTGEIKLAVTVALKKEVPHDWFMSQDVPVMTLKSLKAGALGSLRRDHRGIMVVITGTGPYEAKEAAQWISNNLKPLFVINIGTCGILDRRYHEGQWLIPETIMSELAEEVQNDTRIPFPHHEKTTYIPSLLSVKKADMNDSPGKQSIVDMEGYAQARVFAGADTTFHCLKMGTDYADEVMISDFQRNLEFFVARFRKLFSCIEQDKTDVTVIIPVFNRQETISRAIDSVLDQSFPPDEIIVVNDGSTDNTSHILNKYGDKITVMDLPVNSGASAARNAGVDHANTAWVSFLDSDDCWSGDKLEKQMAYLRKYPFYEIIQSEEIWIRKGVRVNQCSHHKKPEGWIWEHSLERCLVSPSGVLMKKSLFDRYGGFDESLPVCEDYDLWLKISRHHPVGLEPSLSVTKYGGHSDQLSQKYPAMDRFRVRSLLGLLEHEGNEDYRKKIIHVLTMKLNILLSGYEKRNNNSDADECRKVLDSLKEYDTGSAVA